MLFILCFFGFFLYLTTYQRMCILAVPFQFFCSAALFLYLFSLFNALYAGFVILQWMGILTGIYIVLFQRERLNYFKKSDLAYLLCLLAYAGYYFIISKKFAFTGWDEFSHWAISIKYIYNKNALWRAGSPIMFAHYPPVQQLSQYFIVKSMFWSERMVLAAQGAFVISALLSVVSHIQKVITAAFVFGTCIFLIYILSFDFAHVYVDALLAVSFAACFLLAVKRDKGRIDYYAVYITTVALVLTKEVGLIFSMVVIGAFIISEWHRIKPENKKVTWFLNDLWPVFLLLLSVVIGYKSWGYYCRHIGAEQNHAVYLVSLFQGEQLQRFGLTVTEFLKRISVNPFEGISIWHASILLMAAGFIVALFRKRGNIMRTGLELSVIGTGFFLYLLFLLFAYLVYFSPYEGVRLASFERYSKTYLLTWMIVLAVYAVRTLEAKNSTLAIIASFLMLAGTFYIVRKRENFKEDSTGIRPSPVIMQSRKRVQLLAAIVKKYIRPGEEVFFINQHSTGLETYLFNYEMTPFKTGLPGANWSFGNAYFPGDVWTVNQRMRDAVKKADYLAVYNSDRQFWNDNKDLFEPSSIGSVHGVYRIIKDTSHVISFKRLY